MAEDGGKDEQSDLDSAVTPAGYISLDQAQTLALQYARASLDIYGRYADRELVWETVSVHETEDSFQGRLAYRPAQCFRGRQTASRTSRRVKVAPRATGPR